MKTPKFEIGDEVKVLRASTISENILWGDVWFPLGMDKFIGNTYIIEKIQRKYYKYPSYYFKGYRFPEFVLQRAGMFVGEQLLFDFMK